MRDEVRKKLIIWTENHIIDFFTFYSFTFLFFYLFTLLLLQQFIKELCNVRL